MNISFQLMSRELLILKVTPSNAVMTIDGEEVDYTEPVMLKFGSHVLTLAANYYEAYTETFTVSSAYSTKKL